MKQRVILIASVIIGQYLRAKDRDYKEKERQLTRNYRKIAIIGAKRNLPSGTVLTSDDLGVMDVIENAVRGHVVEEKDFSMLLNYRLQRSLSVRDPVYWSDIEGGNPLNLGLAGDIKDHQRAISISVGGAAAVSGMVKPNDHVDVLGTFSFPSAAKSGEMEMVTLTILQDVLILATGHDTAKSQFGSNERASGGYNTVTVEVTPREAEMLVFAEQARGRLVLTLRNPADMAYEKDLPRVDFSKIQEEIKTLNDYRQQKLLGKPLR